MVIHFLVKQRCVGLHICRSLWVSHLHACKNRVMIWVVTSSNKLLFSRLMIFFTNHCSVSCEISHLCLGSMLIFYMIRDCEIPHLCSKSTFCVTCAFKETSLCIHRSCCCVFWFLNFSCALKICGEHLINFGAKYQQTISSLPGMIDFTLSIYKFTQLREYEFKWCVLSL